MRIPVRGDLAGTDRIAVLEVQHSAVRQLVAFALAAVAVHHRDFARARHGNEMARLVLDGLEVVELDRTVGLDRDGVDRGGTRRRTTDVERTHGELRAGLAD